MFAAANQNSSKVSARDQPARVDARLERKEKPESNPVWQSLALSPTSLQPKLAVSQPDDPYEREADRVADSVMRMASTQSATQFSFSPPRAGVAQRKCASCEEEEQHQIQRKEHTASTDSPTVPSSIVDQALSLPGRPLDETTRSFMEPRFGYDFRHVRVHDNSSSATSAATVNANAYTIGPHIVFGAGMYQPQSNHGRRLLAHELAHTVQQASSPLRLQRDVSDFRVTQVQPDPEGRTRGQADRFFFEIEQSEFRDTVPEEAAERKRLEAWATENKGKHVTLIGRASQEGSRSSNRELARKRAVTVASILRSHGVIVDSIKVDMKFEDRPVDYRFYRSVEIAGDRVCNVAKDLADCEAAFAAAHKRATEIGDAAMARLRPDTDPAPATPPPAGAPPRDSRDAVLSTHFPGIPRATLLPLFESIVTRLSEVDDADGHTCNDRCTEKCERPASAAAGGALELCGPFYDSSLRGGLSTDTQVFVVLHETTHSAVVPGSKPPKSVGIDFAYSKTRMFGVLEGSEALRNADSFVMTLFILAEGTSGAPAVLSARGSAPADDLRLTTPPTESGDRNRTARRAIGFAEAWLNYSAFWAPNAYDFVAASLISWSSDLDSNGHVLVELWAAPFQMNHPGNTGLSASKVARVVAFQTEVSARGFSAPPKSSHATPEDRTKVAGIYDRYKRMLKLLDSALTVDLAASGDGSWSTAAGLPGLGTDVQLADSFFTSLSKVEQSRHIIRLMARAMSDIPRSWEEAYVEGADGVRQYRGLGP